jgi:hypothetical protein
MRETAFDGLINPCVRSRYSRSVAVGLRGIGDQERPMPLIAVKEGLQQLAHGFEVIAIE